MECLYNICRKLSGLLYPKRRAIFLAVFFSPFTFPFNNCATFFRVGGIPFGSNATDFLRITSHSSRLLLFFSKSFIKLSFIEKSPANGLEEGGKAAGEAAEVTSLVFLVTQKTP